MSELSKHLERATAPRASNTFTEAEVEALQRVCRAAVLGERIEPYALPGFRSVYGKVVRMKARCAEMRASLEGLDAALSEVKHA